MSKPNFGVFIDFWNGHPNHLPFLNLRESNNEPKDWNLKKSIELIDEIMLKNTEESIIESIELLLNSENWRPHLVALMAIFKLKEVKQQKHIKLLWERLARGSWVSPQILVILSIIDTAFASVADGILANGFTVTYSELSPIEHHSARGPSGPKTASQKIKEAIYFLRQGSIIDLNSGDSGGRIAEGWKNNLLHLVETKKLQLNIR